MKSQKKLMLKKKKATERNKRQAAFRAKKKERKCGACSLCCYVYPLAEFAKPAGKWCQFKCEQGCSLHDQERPPVCTEFQCVWLQHPEIPARYRPDRIGCLLKYRRLDVIEMIEAFNGAAERHHARNLIDILVDNGKKVVTVWFDEQGERTLRAYYDPAKNPVPPSWDELLRLNPRQQAAIAQTEQFLKTGHSDCVWKPVQHGNTPQCGDGEYQLGS